MGEVGKEAPLPFSHVLRKSPGKEVGETCVYNAACLPSFCSAFSQALRSNYFGDVPEANGRETLTSSLGLPDPKRIGRAE